MGSPASVIARIVGLPMAAALPLAIALTTDVFAGSTRIIAIVATVLYEVAVVAIGIATTVLKEVRTRWTARFVEDVDQRLLQLASRYSRTYLQYVRTSSRYVDLKGLATRGEYTLSMDETFVQLTVDPQALHNLNRNLLAHKGSIKSKNSVWTWIERAKDESSILAIIGPPGSGKTTLLKHVAYSLALGKWYRIGRPAFSRLPVFIALRDHKDAFTGDQGPPKLPSLIREALTEVPKEEPPGWTERRLAKGNLIVMLDGLDEMAEPSTRQTVCAWADKQRELYPDTLFIVTSRPFGYKNNPLAVATVVQVNPFSESQLRSFLKNWYLATTIRSFGEDNKSARLAARTGYDDLLGRLEASPQLLEMAVNPLLLTMIANVHHYRGALPGSRCELYAEVCDVFLGKRHQARGVPIDMTAGQKQVILQSLAYRMMKSEVRDVDVTAAGAILEQALANVAPDLSPADFLRRTEESSGLIVERENGVYGFAHLTFQEYFASCYIKEHRLADVLVGNIGESWWRETSLLYCAQADATPIVLECLKRGDDDHSLLELAIECIEDAQELGYRARELLERKLNPPTSSINRSARISAGMLRIFQRARRFERVSSDTYVARIPVCNAEYQAFLDINTGYRPQHWNTTEFADGRADDPVLGISRSDALAFASWLDKLIDDGRHYGLPNLAADTRPTELQQLKPQRFNLKAYWADINDSWLINNSSGFVIDRSVGSSDISILVQHIKSSPGDKRSLPPRHLMIVDPDDLRNYRLSVTSDIRLSSTANVASVLRDRMVRVADDYSAPTDKFASLLQGDWNTAKTWAKESRRDSTHRVYISIDRILGSGGKLDADLCSLLNPASSGPAIMTRMERQWSDANVLDIPGLCEDIEKAVHECSRLAPHHPRGAELLSTGDSLRTAAGSCLDSSRNPAILSDDAQNLRTITRVLAVAAIQLLDIPCQGPPKKPTALAQRIGRVWAPRRPIPDSQETNINPEIAIPQSSTQVLLVSIVTRLLLFELRLRGEATPNEGIVLVRRPAPPIVLQGKSGESIHVVVDGGDAVDPRTVIKFMRNIRIDNKDW